MSGARKFRLAMIVSPMARAVLLLIWLVSLAAAESSLEQLSAEALGWNAAAALSPAGHFVAFQDGAGAVWIRDVQAERSKQIAKGGGKAEFSWSPDEKFVYLRRGGEAARYSVPSGHLGGAIAGSAPLSSAEVSPDGHWLAFILENNLSIAGVDGRKIRPLTTQGTPNLLVGATDFVYGREFDMRTHYWWSPDSSSIAFIETEFQDADHYVKAGGKLPLFRLKIVDVATGQVRTVSESSEQWPYLMRVVWHPDSRRIAFYRMNRLQTVADLCLFEEGALKTVLTEKDAYWVNAPETPVFVDDGRRIVVSSERSGGRHVYLYELDGRLVRDMTPAGLEIYRLHAALDTKGGIYVSGSLGNKQEQQLYRLDTAGGEWKQLTSGAGWHVVNLDAMGNAYLDRYSTAMSPPVIWWHGIDAGRREVLKFPVTQKPVVNEFVAIKTHDNVQLAARLFKPEDFDAKKKYPLILYTFSGPRGRVVEDSWDGWQMAWNRYMVRKGFLVMAVDVRGSGGYGHLFEEYIHYRFGAQETADLREVVSYLRRQSYVDGARLGIWGCDYGAHTVVHAMLQFPGGFKAGVADSPIIEWTEFDAYFTERYLGLPARRITEYDDSTALDDAARMTGTLLVLGSDKNPWIRAGQVAALQKAFAEVKRNKEVIKRLQVGNVADVDYREHPAELSKVMQRMAEFFEGALSSGQ